MLVTFDLLDGALGFSSAAADGHVKLGVAATGTVNELTSLTDGQQAVKTFTSGVLVEGAAFSLANGKGTVFGLRLPVTTAGTFSAVTTALQVGSDGALALTASTPLDTYSVIVLITREGKVAGPQPAFQISLDNGINFSEETAVPAGGVYQGILGTTGIKLTFTNGATGFKVGDKFTFTTTAPTWSNTDLNAGLQAVRADPRTWEFVHVLGTVDSAAATVVQTAINAMARDGRFVWAIIEPRDIAANESEDAWMTSISGDFASVVSTYGQMTAVAGYGNITSAVTGNVLRRSLAWPVAARAAAVPLQEHLGRSKSGPLAGIVKSTVDKMAIYHDERVKPGLAVSRFLTVESRIGKSGYYVGGGTSKRSPGTLAESNSDYSLLMNVRVILYAASLCLQFGSELLGDQVEVNPDGTITEQQANEIDASMTAKLRARLVPKYCVRVRAVVDRREKILTTQTVPVKVLLLPYGYAQQVAFTAGFENPNLVVAQAA